jgi:DNA-binding transcriptional ArsR family regulator
VAAGRAAELAERCPGLADPLGATLACALLEAELCECDLATVAGRAEGEVLAALAALESRGVVGWRRVDGMRYFRLADPAVAAFLEAAAADGAP